MSHYSSMSKRKYTYAVYVAGQEWRRVTVRAASGKEARAEAERRVFGRCGAPTSAELHWIS